MGVTHLVIDIPVARTAKIPDMETAEKIKKIFVKIAEEFNIKTEVVISQTCGPVGKGIGPALEMRDVMRVLQQKENRPMDLEDKAVKLSGALLELTGKVSRGLGGKKARESLTSGLAARKMKDIMESQGGNPSLDSELIHIGEFKHEVVAENSGEIKFINNNNLVEVCRILGTPDFKESGVYLNKSVGEKYVKGNILFTLYSESEQRLNSAIDVLGRLSIYK